MKSKLDWEMINNTLAAITTGMQEVDEMEDRLAAVIEKINVTFEEVANLIDDIMA